MLDVEGRVAFITGGGSGVGLGMAKAFVAAGMRVAIADVRADHSTPRRGARGTCTRSALDVTDRDAFARAADETERVLGNVHVALQQRRDQPLQRHRRCDLPGLGLGARRQPPAASSTASSRSYPGSRRTARAGTSSTRRRWPRSSQGPGAGIYTTAKFAVHGLSDALRWSLLPHGIGVSMVCPGLVKSKIYESDLIRPAELSTDATPADEEFMRILPGLHEAGMAPEEIGDKVRSRSGGTTSTSSRTPSTATSCARSSTRRSRRSPTSRCRPDRLAVEEGRRAGKAAALTSWPDD